jgi:hypothetical protein
MVAFLKQLNLYLGHFPTHEKHALCHSIRSDAYQVFDLMGELLGKKIKDERLLRVMKLFLSTGDSESGIPIGNLLSQLYALIYLNPLDHYIKRELGQKLYVRYVDDFIIFGMDLEEARAFKSMIEYWLDKNLKLSLSKVTIHKIRRGTNFVGYRTWKGYRLVRKRSMYQFRKAVKANNKESIASMLGHAKGTQSMSYYTKIQEGING